MTPVEAEVCFDVCYITQDVYLNCQLVFLVEHMFEGKYNLGFATTTCK